MAANSTLVVPNPLTHLAFLPPAVADQFQITTYVIVGGLSAFIWDWVMSLSDEIKCLRQSGLRGLNSVYFLSRLGTLAYCVGGAIYFTTNVAHCRALLYGITFSYVVAMPATSLLFFFRVRAIWNNSTLISGFFGLVWLGNLGTSFIIPFATNGAHIGPTQRCITTQVGLYASTPFVLNAINDTLIFIAISLRIVEFSCAGNTWRAKSRSFVSGDGLPRMSKGLLQSGQLYYFATIGISIIMSAMSLSLSIPPFYRAMLSVPNIAVENAMACRVFRAVKLGFIRDDISVYSRTTATPASRLQFGHSHEVALKHYTFHKSQTRQVDLEISQTMDMAPSYPDAFGYDKQKAESSVSDQV